MTVQYAVPEARDVALHLYDVLGRRVKMIADSKEQGRKEVRLDVSDLTSGMYFLRLQTGRTVKTQRLTIVK